MSPVPPVTSSLPAIAGHAGALRGRGGARRDADAGAAAFLLALGPALASPETTIPTDTTSSPSATTLPAGADGEAATSSREPAGSILSPRTQVAARAATDPGPVGSDEGTTDPAPDALAPAPVPEGRWSRVRPQPFAAAAAPAPESSAGAPTATAAPLAVAPDAPVVIPAALAALPAATATVTFTRRFTEAGRDEPTAARPATSRADRAPLAAGGETSADAGAAVPRDEDREAGLRGRSRAPVGRETTRPTAPTGTPAAESAAGLAATPSRSVDGRGPAAVATPVAAPRLPESASRTTTPGGQVTVTFADEDGVEGRLRVSLRGGAVRATIVARDPAEAQELQSGLGELRSTLGERGFADARVAVQGVTVSGPSGSCADEPRSEHEGRHARQQEDHAGHPDGRRDGDLDSFPGNSRRRSSRRQSER